MCVANIRGRVENRSTSKPASRNKMGRVQTWLSEKVAVVISVLDSRGSTGIMAERDSAPGRSSLRRLCPRRGSGWSCARWTGRPAAAAEAARWRAPRPPTRGVPTAPGCSSRRASAPRPDRCPACRSHCPTAASLSPARIHAPVLLCYQVPRLVKRRVWTCNMIPPVTGAKFCPTELQSKTLYVL